MNGVQFEIPEGGRLICIADCHGDYVLLKRLLDRLQVQSNDVLAFIGDFSNKGTGNLACVSYLMQLSLYRKRTLVLAGNGEYANARDFASGDPQRILRYCAKWKTNNLYRDWAGQCGFDLIDEDNVQQVHTAVLSAFSDQLNWLYNLPLYALSDRYLLVHGSMAKIPEDGEATRDHLFGSQVLFSQPNETGRWQIVGHLPCANLGQGINEPFIDAAQKVINIDGGVNTLKYTQLNALVCTSTGFETISVDHYPLYEVKQTVEAQHKAPALPYRWNDRMGRVIEYGVDFCLFTTETGRSGMVKTQCVRMLEEGRAELSDCLGAVLSVTSGEPVKLLSNAFGSWCYIKKANGLTGFVPATCIGAAAPQYLASFEQCRVCAKMM